LFEFTLLEKVLGSIVVVFGAMLAYGKSIFRTKKECVDMTEACSGKHEKRDYIKRPEYVNDQEQQNKSLFNSITALTNEIGGMREDLREIEKSRRLAEEKWVEFIKQHTEFVATIHLRVKALEKSLEEWKKKNQDYQERSPSGGRDGVDRRRDFDKIQEDTGE